MVVPLAEAMVTDGITELVTLMVMAFDPTIAGEAQVALEVSVQETTSPFERALFEYVTLFVPVFTPFSIH